ncbi:phage tail sheath family protein [Vibrio quintilis]|uniref:Phage tail sheath protein n=1 Tax=Vibrio quintilis TaxID=1117707 RepID=A0A1M7YV58_9VIBR|nr:phage tail sheath C-terminal domain-containing protein [Vibrio quintilis]SHO56468.1 Phage tail sheath protein [Vibrio quintilis]
MAQYKTPNVYVKELSTLPASVAEVATAIPAFIGYTELVTDKDDENKSLIGKPIRITSLSEYEESFGGPYAEAITVKQNPVSEEFYIPETEETALAQFFLYQAVQHFFANGGGACYIVSTGDYSGEVVDTDFDLAVLEKVDEVTLFVMPETVHLSEELHYGLHKTALTQASKLMDRFAVTDVKQLSVLDGNIADDSASMRDNLAGELNELKYGATYYPYVRTTIARHYTDDTVTIEYADERVGGDPQTLADLYEESTAQYNEIVALLRQNYLILPPSAAVAGCMAKTDTSRGVWKAPANVALSQVLEPMVSIDNSQQENLNVDVTAGKSVNAIRTFVGKGTLIWGARTLAGNDLEWRYVSVRRFFNMVEESLQKSTAFAVFEPNTAITWLKLKTMTENYLRTLWQQGALMGSSEDQAFFVQVGLGESMTEQDILEGIMRINIGLAATRPAEFIELTFQHKSLES